MSRVTRTSDRRGSALAGHPGLAPWNAQALTAFPQAFATDPELASQLGFGHVVLMLENEMLEVVFQGEVFGRFVVVVAGIAIALLWRQANELVVFQIAQFDVDAQQFGRNLRAFAQDDGAL